MKTCPIYNRLFVLLKSNCIVDEERPILLCCPRSFMSVFVLSPPLIMKWLKMLTETTNLALVSCFINGVLHRVSKLSTSFPGVCLIFLSTGCVQEKSRIRCEHNDYINIVWSHCVLSWDGLCWRWPVHYMKPFV